jgi:uncharacterized membrane protein YccC
MTDKADNTGAAKVSVGAWLRSLPARRASELRQTVRVTVAVAAAYAIYKLLDLQQGYWAVFTVLIIMQGSIGSTLGAAIDRLIGTMGGAFLGGIAVAMHTGTTLSLGIILVMVTALATLAAGIRPQLRIASVTAAILLLSAPPEVQAVSFVIDRIIEIAIGATLNEPLSARVSGTLGPAAAVLLRAEALLAERCTAALRATKTVERGDSHLARLAFANTFDELRQTGIMRVLDFDAAGRVFGLGFTLERLHRDLSDLADRIDEIATGQTTASAEVQRDETA